MNLLRPIGVFDSGYGGLTILNAIKARLPQYDYVYLGDNARAPYGTRSFESVYRYTLECTQWFFRMHCPLVILACNTASAKALRTIQQKDIPGIGPEKRVLGVIRPTTEIIGQFTQTGHVGILATSGTVQSGSYPVEIGRFFPGIQVVQQACPMWVPLIENNEHHSDGADYFVQKYLDLLIRKDQAIDAMLLGCTHYPLLMDKIVQYLPSGIAVISQGEIVATSLAAYLDRHPEIEGSCTKSGQMEFYTTDSTTDFDDHATIFYGEAVRSRHAGL